LRDDITKDLGIRDGAFCNIMELVNQTKFLIDKPVLRDVLITLTAHRTHCTHATHSPSFASSLFFTTRPHCLLTSWPFLLRSLFSPEFSRSLSRHSITFLSLARLVLPSLSLVASPSFLAPPLPTVSAKTCDFTHPNSTDSNPTDRRQLSHAPRDTTQTQPSCGPGTTMTPLPRVMTPQTPNPHDSKPSCPPFAQRRDVSTQPHTPCDLCACFALFFLT
jgi:hypothetical protein